MIKRNAPFRLVLSVMDDAYLPAGSAEYYVNQAGGATTGMLIVCPCGCGDVSAIEFDVPETAAEPHPKWQWDGDRLKPTLTPSLHKTAGCGWHGYLRAGVFEEC